MQSPGLKLSLSLSTPQREERVDLASVITIPLSAVFNYSFTSLDYTPNILSLIKGIAISLIKYRIHYSW